MTESFKNWVAEVSILPQFRATVTTLLETLIKPEGLKRDLFFALLLVLMNENDFLILKESSGETISIVDCIASLYKKNSVINEAILVMKGFETMRIKLFQVPIYSSRDIILINAVLPQQKFRTYSMCVPLQRYILTSEMGLPRNFMNLDLLCDSFKENIIDPVANTILNYNRLPCSSLSGLPTDIVRKILFVLPVEDIVNLSESCKRINEIVNEDCLWFHLYDRDFGDKHKREAVLATDYYRDIYRNKYLETKEHKAVKSLNTDIVSVAMSGYLMYSCIPDPRWEVIL